MGAVMSTSSILNGIKVQLTSINSNILDNINNIQKNGIPSNIDQQNYLGRLNNYNPVISSQYNSLLSIQSRLSSSDYQAGYSIYNTTYANFRRLSTLVSSPLPLPPAAAAASQVPTPAPVPAVAQVAPAAPVPASKVIYTAPTKQRKSKSVLTGLSLSQTALLTSTVGNRESYKNINEPIQLIPFDLSKQFTNNIQQFDTFGSENKFQNGVYNITCSNGNTPPYSTFNVYNNKLVSADNSKLVIKNPLRNATNIWLSGQRDGGYNNLNGDYNGFTTTVDANGTTIAGEWIQIQFPFSFRLHGYGIVEPYQKFYVLGSKDGFSWEILDNKTNNQSGKIQPYTNLLNDFAAALSNDVILPIIYHDLSNKQLKNYSYYRVIVNKNVVTKFKNGVFSAPTTGMNILQMFGVNENIDPLFHTTVEQFENLSNGYNNMPLFEGLNSISDDESMLIGQLIEFNKKYERYMHCNNSSLNSDCAAIGEPTLSDINTQLDRLLDKSSSIINSLPKSGLSASEYESKYHQIISEHSNVLKLRNELDNKLTELYNPEQSVNADYKKNLDSTIYSGILVSALATSMLYYVFTEL